MPDRRGDLVAPMWRGMAAAAALSVGAGIAVHLTVENLTGEPRLLAVAVLTWMIFWMRRQAHLIRGELQHSVDQAIAGRGDVRLAVTMVAFLAVAREGLEAALFLIAAATTEESWAVLVGGLIGLAAASVLGAMFGWDPRPSIEQVVAYLLFLVTVTWLFLRAPRPGQGAVSKVAGNAKSSS